VKNFFFFQGDGTEKPSVFGGIEIFFSGWNEAITGGFRWN